MRLAQLARKISQKPSEIVSFLAANGLVIEDSSNAKVSDVYTELVLKHFAPELLHSQEERIMEEPIDQEVNEQATVTEEAPIAEAESTLNTIEEETSIPEVIKPAKVELPGLKVVGKIELPEPKAKEEVEPEASETESAGKVEEPARRPSRPENRRSVRPSREQERGPRKNPIALKREREEREALRKRLEEKEIQKEKRTQRYLKKVSNYTLPTRPLKKNKHEDEYEVFVEEKAKPKSLIGKLLKWFVSK